MSSVTDVILTTACGEQSECITLINAHLKSFGFGELTEVSASKGAKEMQTLIYVGGFSGLWADDFTYWLSSLKDLWEYPESVTLHIKEENDDYPLSYTGSIVDKPRF